MTLLEVLGAFALFLLIVLAIGWCTGFVKLSVSVDWSDE